jgi:nitrate reductase NapD
MLISGIVVACVPEHLASVEDAINGLDWAEVHYSDPKGKLVVVIEAADADASGECIGVLQAIPHVTMAAMSEFLDEAKA